MGLRAYTLHCAVPPEHLKEIQNALSLTWSFLSINCREFVSPVLPIREGQSGYIVFACIDLDELEHLILSTLDTTWSPIITP